ncbi:MAG TPA: FmdB family transcriptional regulator [Opitutaceae bacterium]|nr:FmdB family transcriptional regulator [Opitutaceae bacterium]
MPIYEYYCPDNHTIYQFYAKTLAQGRSIPRCPDNPGFRMEKMISAFAVTKGGGNDVPAPAEGAGPGAGEDPRMDAAMEAMERDFANVDENDPRAMGRMMRRMAEISGEKIEGEMEEVVRKLEEGADPEALEEQLGGEAPGGDDPSGGDGPEGPGREGREARRRFRARREPARDPKLYDYD